MSKHRIHEGRPIWSRRELLEAMAATAVGLSVGSAGAAALQQNPFAGSLRTAVDPVFPDSLDPVLSARLGREVRIPNTCPALEGRPNLHAGPLSVSPLRGARSLLGHPIEVVRDPHQDLEVALEQLLYAAHDQDGAAMRAAASEARAILLGETQGRVYDGFSLLNFNRGAFVDDHVPGAYKMKALREQGEGVSAIDGERRRVWGVTINLLWYGQNFDADTFLLRIPHRAHPFDELQITWRVYSLVQEDLAPSTILNDGFGRIFHGFDSTFAPVPSDHLCELTVNYPSLTHFRGLYLWGWGVHPPRVQFLQPVREVAEDGRLDPAGRSFAERTARDLTLANIAEIAPEKKILRVAEAALAGAAGSTVAAMLSDPGVGPRGSFRGWLQLAADQRRLPPEAWEVLAREDGLSPGDFGPYDIVLAYLNNEIYGDSPYAQRDTEGKGGVVRDWRQGEVMRVKVINFDAHTHYYRNVDFGARLVDENRKAFGNGRFSFEKFSPKPTYGVPKVAEMQWRSGWGYVPHVGIAAQSGLFPRRRDRLLLEPFRDQLGKRHYGYQFRQASGYFRFDPPAAIRVGPRIPAGEPLRDVDGRPGLRISLDAEAFGTAKMPEKTLTTHPNQLEHAALQFPGFLRNPSSGGDIIPPTPIWSPFLTLHPETGELWGPDGLPWVDATYFHGRPVAGGRSIVASVEAPRASAQLFYQFDPLFHDNMIFSLHPRADIVR